MDKLLWKMGMIIGNDSMPCRIPKSGKTWYMAIAEKIMDVPFKGSTIRRILEDYKEVK